jgi:hypothetical protein
LAFANSEGQHQKIPSNSGKWESLVLN